MPYYLPDVASQILAVLAELVAEIPPRELYFSRTPGLKAVLVEDTELTTSAISSQA